MKFQMLLKIVAFLWIVGAIKLEGQILNESDHIQNQRIFASIIDQELKKLPQSFSPNKRAFELSQRIHFFGEQALSQGFNLSAYTYSRYSSPPFLVFAAIPIWEGGKQKIPLTFFVYIWPTESLALETQKNAPHPNDYYASDIHRHPISCAFTVLKGQIDQESYTQLRHVSNPLVKQSSCETLRAGQCEIDSGKDESIHRLICRGNEPAITLHAYGAPSAPEVFRSFERVRSTHSYRNVISN